MYSSNKKTKNFWVLARKKIGNFFCCRGCAFFCIVFNLLRKISPLVEYDESKCKSVMCQKYPARINQKWKLL